MHISNYVNNAMWLPHAHAQLHMFCIVNSDKCFLCHIWTIIFTCTVYNIKHASTTNRAVCGYDAYLLRCFSTDLYEIGHKQSFRVREQPRKVGIKKFQTVAMVIRKNIP